MRHRVSDVSEQEAAADGTSSSEYVDILARRVVFSRTHTLLCTSVILAGVVEVLWILLPTPSSGVGRLPDHWLFGAVETYVTIGLLGELLLRLALQRRGFWRNRANLFDASVVGISLLSSLLYALGAETPMEALFAEAVVIARVVFRLLRLFTATKGLRRQQQASDTKLEINFSDEDLEQANDAEDELLMRLESGGGGGGGSGSGDGGGGGGMLEDDAIIIDHD